MELQFISSMNNFKRIEALNTHFNSLTYLFTKQKHIDSFPNNKILDQSKIKAFADKIIVICDQKIEICFTGKGRKYCGKRRKCWLPEFFLFPQCFQKAFLPGFLNVGIV